MKIPVSRSTETFPFSVDGLRHSSSVNMKPFVIKDVATCCDGGIYHSCFEEWKPHATRPKGRPRLRWDDDVRDDLRKMGVNNWKQKAQERKPWRGIIEQAKTHKEL